MEILVTVTDEILENMIKVLKEADSTIDFDNVDKITFYKE